MSIESFLQYPLLSNPVIDWLICLGILIAVNLTVSLVKRVIARRVAPLTAHTQSGLDDLAVRVIDRTHAGLVLLISIYIASHYLDLGAGVEKALRGIVIVAAFVQIGRWLGAVLNNTFARYQARATQRDAGSATAIRAMGYAAHVVMWSMLLLLTLDNLGIDVTAMVAGLGIGGIAVALAVQNVLGDVLASVSIIVDRPFVVGDFIIVDDYLGTVQHIGLKTTHVRSLGGELIIFSNNDLLKARVRNYKRMVDRRAVFTFGVSYATPPEQLEGIAQYLRDMIGNHADMRLERAHFFKFGDSSLDFEVAYWVKSPDYGFYMDCQQEINLGLMKELNARGVVFAHPIRMLKFDAPVQVAPGVGEAADRAGEAQAVTGGRASANGDGAAPAGPGRLAS